MRNVSQAKGGLIKSMVNSGIKVTNVWSYLGEEVGGFDNLGMTMKDVHKTSHRLCLWHISNNAPSHLGDLKSDRKFQSLLNQCMSGCDSEEEFENTWAEMINEYKLQDHKWLKSMYKIRRKWSTAYSKSVFSADIKSSQRSESTNSVLGEIASNTTHLPQFSLAFEKMVKKWRQLGSEKEFKNSQSKPPLVINSSKTLEHASMIYTHKLFKRFLNEYLEGAGGSTSTEIQVCDNVSYHEVTSNRTPHKKYNVAFDSSNSTINCSCHKFDSLGILCSHALRIYNIKGILRILDQYFLKRWSIKARSVISEHTCEVSKETENEMSNSDATAILYRSAIMKSFYNLVLDSQHDKEAQQIMWKWLDVGVERVQQHFSNLNVDSNAMTNEKIIDEKEDNETVEILNPHQAKTKGMSSTRKKSHFETRKRSATKVKQNKSSVKQKGIQLCATNSSMGCPSNVSNCMDRGSNVLDMSFIAPPQEYHSVNSSSWSFNSSSIPYTSMLQGMGSYGHLSQGSNNYHWLPPTPINILQDRQEAKRI